jgi:GGDEF domain-containing protein
LVSRQVVAALGRRFDLEGQERRPTACVGISHYPRDGEDADLLLKNADPALSEQLKDFGIKPGLRDASGAIGVALQAPV